MMNAAETAYSVVIKLGGRSAIDHACRSFEQAKAQLDANKEVGECQYAELRIDGEMVEGWAHVEGMWVQTHAC